MVGLVLALAVVGADREYTFDGVVSAVSAVDAKKQEVTIKRDNGKITVVTFDKETDIRFDTKPVKFVRVKVGQEVRCVMWLEKRIATVFCIYDVIDRPPLVSDR